jgi:hypothetical protein
MSSSAATSSIASLIRDVLASEPGLTDRQLTDRILGVTAHPSQINQACR